MEPDDVVIANIAGQALDILFHGPLPALKNGIIKTFTHTCIPTRPCTLLKNAKNNNSKMLNSPSMMPSFTGPLLVQCAGGRLSGSLAPAPLPRSCRVGKFEQKTFVKVFRKYSHIARHKIQSLKSPNMTPFFTGPLLVQCGGGRLPGSLADAAQAFSTSEDLSPRTVLTKSICICVQYKF